MNNEAVYIGGMAGDAVRVAELIWDEDYLAAVTLLRALAEKGQAAETACWAAKILRALPEYKVYLIDILTLNLERINGQVYAQDTSYRHYIEILYSGAAQNLEKSGFITEAKRLRSVIECFDSRIDLNSITVVDEAEDTVNENLNKDIVTGDYLIENNKITSCLVPEENPIADNVADDISLHEVLPETTEAELFIVDEADTVEISEPVTYEVQPEPEAPVEIVVDNNLAAEKATQSTEEVIIDSDDTSISDNNAISDDNKINIDNILNIKSDEIDEHFEKMKQITSEAIRKAEYQVQKLKSKMHSSPKTAETISKIKETVRQASVLSVHKVSELAPAMQKLKGLAGKFKFKKKSSQD